MTSGLFNTCVKCVNIVSDIDIAILDTNIDIVPFSNIVQPYPGPDLYKTQFFSKLRLEILQLIAVIVVLLTRLQSLTNILSTVKLFAIIALFGVFLATTIKLWQDYGR